MSVKAEDQRALWQHGHIYATAAYNNLPSYILQDVLEDQVNMASGDIDMPSFSGATNLNAQWMDATPEDILTQVCERLGYYFRFTNEGKASARQISNVAAADHVYSNNKTVISYSPDDRYSDFTNRVTVQGQELEYTQVYYEEERITQLSGTLGWWGCRDEHIVWFSDDKSRRCINPRLNAIETSTSIPFKLAGSVTESITECGALDDYKFCTVNISAPNLIPVLAAAIATWGTSMSIGNYAPFGCGLTVSVGRWIEKAGLFASLMTLGSVANYQLEVWAQPLGSIRRSVQGTWNDTEHQTEINAVVEQVIEDPLCYSAADCNAVANFEGMVVQMQRKRIKIEKVAHLQDEDGDTIQVVHPYGGSTMTLYVASLKRKYKKGAYFLDEIEGWVCS
jgi:hypothetical protein